MTRCYEYYCMFRSLPENCEKSPRMQLYIRDYMRFMEQKGVKFDRSPSDKELFLYIQGTRGTEVVVTRKKSCTKVPKEAQTERRCPFCGNPISDFQQAKLLMAIEMFPEEARRIVEHIKQVR